MVFETVVNPVTLTWRGEERMRELEGELRTWETRWDKLLGKQDDQTLAKILGVCRITVLKHRKKLSIPAYVRDVDEGNCGGVK